MSNFGIKHPLWELRPGTRRKHTSLLNKMAVSQKLFLDTKTFYSLK